MADAIEISDSDEDVVGAAAGGVINRDGGNVAGAGNAFGSRYKNTSATAQVILSSDDDDEPVVTYSGRTSEHGAVTCGYALSKCRAS